MNATQALSKMVSPSQQIGRIMRGKIIQIVVTRACDLHCSNCTQGSHLAGKPSIMTVDQFDQACASLEGFYGVVGVFGGNACLHPKFDEICKVMRSRFPLKQRGIWTNNLNGNGNHARITFWPPHSNLNVHMNKEAYEEFCSDWPESVPYLKGLEKDSIHSSPWVSMIDLGIPESERWNMISSCDVNQFWSPAIGIIRGELRCFFCEISYSMAALHELNPNWSGTDQPFPDIGLECIPGWWRKPMADFSKQVNTCCHNCGIPMRRTGQLAIAGDHDEFSKTHEFIARPKVKSRPVKMIEPELVHIANRSSRPATQYLPLVTPGYDGD